MTNTFQPTGFTSTSTFATLASYLLNAGFPDVTSNSVTGQGGYIRNRDTSIDLYVGFGTTAPSKYEIVGALSSLSFNAGMNINEIWIKAASSTVSVGFAEGSGGYTAPTINGIIGSITGSENDVPKIDADGNLVASSITDDGSTVEVAVGTFLDSTLGVTGAATFSSTVDTSGLLTVKAGVAASGATANDFSGGTGTFKTSTGANTLSGVVTVNDATTPSITTASGKTNTGFLKINGKTSGSIKILPVDAAGQDVTVSLAAQTGGGAVLTIPNQGGTSTSFVFVNQVPTGAILTPVTNVTNTMANLTDLSTSLKAAGVYVGQMVVQCSNSTAAEGIAFDFNGGNATMTSFGAGATIVTGGTNVPVTTASTAINTVFDWSTITGTTWITFQINIVVNAAGTFIPRFRESTAHSSGTAQVTSGSLSLRLAA